MAITDWFKDYSEKKENRLLKEFQNRHPSEKWRGHEDAIRSYAQESKGLLGSLTGSGMRKGLDAYTLDHFSDRDLLHKAQDTSYFKSEKMQSGVNVLSQEDVGKHLQTALNEAAKDDGTGRLGAFGVKTSTSHTLAQARAVASKAYDEFMEVAEDFDTTNYSKVSKYLHNKAVKLDAAIASRLPAAGDFAGHFIGASGKESLYNAMGLMTADQKRLYSRPGVSNTIARWGIRSAGLFNVYTGLTSDDPITDVTANVLSGYGLQAGWRGGKAAANVLFGKNVGHASRLLLGAGGAIVAGAVPLAAGEIVKDITKSDSHIKKMFKGSYKQEVYAEDNSSRMALTMRQAGLQKLASSHLNDRGQLLGNEAAILKGVSY